MEVSGIIFIFAASNRETYKKTILMKKLFTLLLVLFATLQAMAYDFQATMSDGRVLYFNVLSKNECEVSRMYYTERNASYVSGSLVIPTQVTDACYGIGKIHSGQATALLEGSIVDVGHGGWHSNSRQAAAMHES